MNTDPIGPIAMNDLNSDDKSCSSKSATFYYFRTSLPFWEQSLNLLSDDLQSQFATCHLGRAFLIRTSHYVGDDGAHARILTNNATLKNHEHVVSIPPLETASFRWIFTEAIDYSCARRNSERISIRNSDPFC